MEVEENLQEEDLEEEEIGETSGVDEEAEDVPEEEVVVEVKVGLDRVIRDPEIGFVTIPVVEIQTLAGGMNVTNAKHRNLTIHKLLPQEVLEVVAVEVEEVEEIEEEEEIEEVEEDMMVDLEEDVMEVLEGAGEDLVGERWRRIWCKGRVR